MSKHDFSTLFTSTEQAAGFALKLQKTLITRNEDFRVLGHSKAMHALSNACGYDNWHVMKSQLEQSHTPEAKLPSKNEDPFFKTGESVVGAAAEKELSRSAKLAQSILADLEDADEDEPLETYAVRVDVMIKLVLSSSVTLEFKIDPEDKEMLDATLRVSGFESHTESVPMELWEKLGKMYEDEIESQLLSLITG